MGRSLCGGLRELIDIAAEIVGGRKKEEYAVDRWY